MRLLAVARKDLTLIVRDRAALAFNVLVPIVVISIVAQSLSGGDTATSLRLPVVNHDRGPVAEVLIEALKAHVKVEEVDEARARRLVGEDEVAAAALVIPEGTSKRYLRGRGSTLQLLTDPAKGSELGILRALLLLADRDAQALADPFSEELIVFEDQSLTGSRLTTSSFEQTIPGFGQMLVLFVYGHLVFGLSLGSSALAFVAMCAAVAFSMTGFSLLVSAAARTREQIIPVGLTIIMITCSIGGCWWPLFQSPEWLQQLAKAFLTAWAMESLQDLILRDRGLWAVTPSIAALVGYGLICTAAGLGLHGLRWTRG